VALIPCDGAAVLTYTGRLWQALAARPSDAAPDDSAVAAVVEMLFRRGVFLQPNFDRRLHGGASWVGLGWRALLVVRIEGAPRQPIRLVWYAESEAR
jgi:hypothetical protein